jgi:multiple sugar transport system substrate-binding protein
MRKTTLTRREFLAGLAVGGGASILTACSTPPAAPQVIEKVVTQEVVKQVTVAPQARGKLTMWIDINFYSRGSEALLKSQVQDWAQQNNVDITYVQEQGDTMTARVNAALEAKQLPDVFYTTDITTLQASRSGQVMDVTDLVTELNKNMGGFSKGILSCITVNGKQLAVPYALSTEVFYARKDLLDKAGLPLPQTWDDVFAAARKIHNPPTVWGLGLQLANTNNGDAENTMLELLWGYGGSVFDKDGATVVLDGQPVRTVLALLKKAWDDGLWPKDVLTGDSAWNNTAYQSGKVAFTINTGSIAKYLAANNPDLLKATALYPVPAGPSGHFAASVANVLLISNTTKVPDLAKNLVRWINDPTRYQTWMTELQGFRVPAYTGLDTMPMWKDPLMKPLGDSLAFTYLSGYPGPTTALSGQVFIQQVLSKMSNHVLVDNWTVDKAVADALTSIQKIKDTLA